MIESLPHKCDILMIAGTRPELIKLSEMKKNLDFCNCVYVYTSQHFSTNMKDIFLKELEGGTDIDLECNTSDVEIIKKSLVNLILKLRPTLILVYGDTNSTLAGALASKETNTKLVHIEAGLRSFDLRMPEERNRIKVDQLSDYLLCPTTLSREYLSIEGIDQNVFVTGNLIVDVSKKFSNIDFPKKKIYTDFILLTLHRAENVDDPKTLEILVEKLNELVNHKIIFPIHPRTLKSLKANNINIPKNVTIVDPLGYVEFLTLLKQSKLVLTDSGGVQEEAIILKKPCITLRNTTERWETILLGGNRLFPLDQKNEGFTKIVQEMLSSDIQKQPYGENVTKKTANIIKKIFAECKEKELDNQMKIQPNRI